MEELRVMLLDKLRQRYTGFDFYEHSNNVDFIQKKGLFGRKTGVIIKKSDMKWNTLHVRAKQSVPFQKPHKINESILYCISEENKICLYKWN